MIEVPNPEPIESQPLSTELETLTPEATAATADSSTHNHTTAAEPVATAVAVKDEGADYEAGMEDFAAALENFDREQAAEAANQATYEEQVVTGTVIKITDKHVVVDVGLKSEGLIPLAQVLDHTGQPKLAIGDTVEVVVEREEPEGGFLVSYEKALKHKVWDTIELAATDKTVVTGMVLGRVKGGLTVDIGIKAFLPGSQVEIRPRSQSGRLYRPADRRARHQAEQEARQCRRLAQRDPRRRADRQA